MRLPWSKKQIEEVKSIPVLKATQNLRKILALSKLSINFNMSQTRPYYANITYKENPTEWRDNQAVEDIELIADSWEDLIEKVVTHFGAKDEI